jgi:amino acid permease
MISVFTLTVAVGVETKPSAAPPGPYKSDWKLVGNPSFYEAISALSSMVFAYAGTPAFFSIISEMREPKNYTKSLIVCQTTVTVVYTVIGIVVYYYCGSYVASPALGSAGALMKRVCYGLALPGLLVSTLILLHVRSFLPGRHNHKLTSI